jgi:RNA polymerase sigma-70 factor (ECF subfamily)
MAVSTPDEDLLAACATGDQQALALLYDRFGNIAYRLAMRILGDAALAQDTVQGGFVAVWREARTFSRSRGTASSWILSIIHRHAVELLRSQDRTRRFLVPPTKEDVMASGTLVAGRGDPNNAASHGARGEVQAAFAALSMAERQVIDLAYWKGLTQSEISSALGIPSETVKRLASSALTRLGEALGQTREARTARQAQVGHPMGSVVGRT